MRGGRRRGLERGEEKRSRSGEGRGGGELRQILADYVSFTLQGERREGKNRRGSLSAGAPLFFPPLLGRRASEERSEVSPWLQHGIVCVRAPNSVCAMDYTVALVALSETA